MGGSIPPANTVTVTFRATIQASAQGGTLSYNSSTAYVDALAPGWPLTAASQPAPLTTNVVASADVAVTVQTLPQLGGGSGGQPRTWTFLVTNNGPSAATGVQVVVTPSTGAPAMVNPRTATVSGGGTCTAFAVGSTIVHVHRHRHLRLRHQPHHHLHGHHAREPGKHVLGNGGRDQHGASFDPVSSNNSATGSVQFDNQPPSTPINLTATRASATQINLAWQASNDNVAIAGYNIYRNGVLVTTTTGTGTTFNDTGLASHLPYWYWVQAVDTAGNVSGNSNGAGAVTFATGTSYRVQYANPSDSRRHPAVCGRGRERQRGGHQDAVVQQRVHGPAPVDVHLGFGQRRLRPVPIRHRARLDGAGQQSRNGSPNYPERQRHRRQQPVANRRRLDRHAGLRRDPADHRDQPVPRHQL